MLRPLGELGPPRPAPVLLLGQGPWNERGERVTEKCWCPIRGSVSYLQERGWTGDRIWASQGDREVPG